jgi:hypothetical protein
VKVAAQKEDVMPGRATVNQDGITSARAKNYGVGNTMIIIIDTTQG